MNRRVAFDKLGGLYVYQDTLNYLQTGWSSNFDAIANAIGDKWIIAGGREIAGNITTGLITSGVDLVPLIGGPILPHVLVETLVGDEQFADGALKPTYYTKRARLVALATENTFPYTELKRLPLNEQTIYESLDRYHKALKGIIQFEPEVILGGLDVSDVNSMAGTCSISGGVAMFNGQIKIVAARSGSYPAYLTSTGEWQDTEPGSGSYITFDPYTSQRYTDVLHRALCKPGKIEMYETLSDRFVDGIGRWEMKGFELAVNMQNRVPLGYWFDGNPITNVSDPQHAVVGNVGGEKAHTLNSNEQGSFDVQMQGDEFLTGGENIAVKGVRFNNENVDIGPNGSYGTAKNVKLKNDAVGHENRQPFAVVVFVKRT
ncbi:MAG TPA: hypothetical protein PKC39_14480 [Ferruginibacter sp.]|nr:hypothetical protein [Ferruginibacter sp.]HMP22162.1 hypothetical protein [Ferruginibacter sp.]